VCANFLPFSQYAVKLFRTELGQFNFRVLRHAGQDLHEHLNLGPCAYSVRSTSDPICLLVQGLLVLFRHDE
jgi:hypothetical protein